MRLGKLEYIWNSVVLCKNLELPSYEFNVVESEEANIFWTIESRGGDADEDIVCEFFVGLK